MAVCRSVNQCTQVTRTSCTVKFMLLLLLLSQVAPSESPTGGTTRSLQAARSEYKEHLRENCIGPRRLLNFFHEDRSTPARSLVRQRVKVRA